MDLTKTQTAAIESFRRFITSRLNKTAEYGDQITKFETYRTEHGSLWLTVETEMTLLPEDNLLRFLDKTHWHVAVGARGALEVWSCPKSIRQFAGRRAFGLNFSKYSAA